MSPGTTRPARVSPRKRFLKYLIPADEAFWKSLVFRDPWRGMKQTVVIRREGGQR